MQEVSQLYENLMASIKPAEGKLAVPLFSSVRGCSTRDAASLGPSYWRLNMERPVLFLSAVESALQVKDLFSSALEIGPHSTLSGPFRQICQEVGEKIQYTNTLTRGVDCTQSVLTALGSLFCQGLVPRLSTLNPPGVTMSNLPTYPWNHDSSYWHETRISREFRNREYPEHELLGARVTGGNDLEPSWRNLLDLNHVPWLNDHVISGDVIFPAAGYVAIIGEAIRQLSKSSSFTIRNLSIEAAMSLRKGQSAEIITRLHPHGTRTKPQPLFSWYNFTVSSFDGDKWYNHCSGEVSMGQNLNQNLFGPDMETIRKVKSPDWYRVGKSAGLEYGPTFQGLQDIRCALRGHVASAKVYDDQLPEGSFYAVHPITIDQLLQCCIVGSFQGHLRKMNKLVLPIHIGELCVATQDVHSDLQLRTQSTSHNASSMLANAQIQAKDGSIMLQCENIQFRTLDNNAADVDNNAMHKFHLLEWKPDIDLIDTTKLLHRTLDLTSCMKLLEELHILCSIETARVLKNIKSSMPHLQRFKEWIEEFITIIQQHGSTIVPETSYMFQITSEQRQARIQTLLEEVLNTPAKNMALAITNLYDAVEDIFLGKTEALGILLADDLLTRVYNFQNMVDHERFLQLLGHSNPDMRILEIGAGTGGFTSTILPALKKPGYGCMFDTYTFTDISAGFFKAAKQRFKDYPNIEFVELDITQDPATQRIQQHSYDLVLASNVSTSTSTHTSHFRMTNIRAGSSCNSKFARDIE
jgi:acyl transferase domain-containing protein